MSEEKKKETKKENTPKEDKTPLEKHVQKEIDKKSFCSISTLKKTNTLKAPFPIELNYEQLICKSSDEFLKGFTIKDNGIYCLKKDIVEKQSGIIKEVIAALTKCLWTGGVMSLSLPIRIFEPRSMLERITDWFSFAPVLLTKAGSIGNKIEAFKYVVAFSLSSLFRSSEQLKSLNPMLGETYQCEWEDGSHMYMEHTCHTPPISHLYLKSSNDLFTVSGYIDMEMGGIMKTMLTNTMQIIPKGRITVNLPMTKQKIDFQFPKITMGGALWGERYMYFSDHMKFEDRANNLKCVIAFANNRKELKGKRIHDIYGRIFNYDYVANQDDPSDPFYSDSMSSHPFPLYNKDIVSEITGSWLEEVKFDNKSYFNIKNSSPPQIYPTKDVLNSDSRYREDKQWLQLSWDNKEKSKLYEEYAQAWKLALEAQQRFERGLRKEYANKNNE
jgi:uncharacterized protein YbgA (DUF1722 family)